MKIKSPEEYLESLPYQHTVFKEHEGYEYSLKGLLTFTEEYLEYVQRNTEGSKNMSIEDGYLETRKFALQLGTKFYNHSGMNHKCVVRAAEEFYRFLIS